MRLLAPPKQPRRKPVKRAKPPTPRPPVKRAKPPTPRPPVKTVDDILGILPKDRPGRIAEPEIIDADLPGTCPYDKAVANGRLTYAEAKTRDELHTRAELAKIELETATLTLEARKLEIAQERGSIVSKEEYLERQEVMVSTFLELLRLAVTDVAVRLPSTQRDVAAEEVLHKCNNAMTALATATAERKPREVAAQAMFDAFRAEQ